MKKILINIILLFIFSISGTAQIEYGKTVEISKDVLLDKIKGGWAGQTIGCTYGLLSGAIFAAQEVLLPITSIVYLHATSVPRCSDWQSPMTLTLLKWKYGLTENWTM